MSQVELPDSDHVIRYVKPSMIGTTGKARGGAFMLRRHRASEDGLSVQWLEYSGTKGASAEVQLLKRATTLRSRLTLSKNGRLAELNVGRTRARCHEEDVALGFVHAPLPDDESHSEILGLPDGDSPEGEMIGDLIAQCVAALHTVYGQRLS